MRYDVVLAGVGGQGVLSVAAIIASTALAEGLEVKQAETHGMAQRGGAVGAHLRLADRPIASDLVARGTAAMILGMEPLESLRHLPFLAADGVLISASTPFRNLPDYPPLEEVLDSIRALPRSLLVEAEQIARRAGSIHTANVAMVGAASRFLPLPPEAIERAIAERFAAKGEKMLEANLTAFRAAREPATPA